MPALNPFIYPGPVPVEKFVGREEELRSLLSRIATGQSTAVVGGPNIGKSSLLKYLAECQNYHARLGEQATRTVFIFQNCRLLSNSSTPAYFWQQILTHVWQACPDDQVRQAMDWAANKGEFGTYALERLFRVVAQRLWQVVLLVDEFDSLLGHANFNTAEFFGALRLLATTSSGLALVTASRLPLLEINSRTLELCPYGSPLFDAFIELNLRPFDSDDVNTLLSKALAGTGVTFEARDHDFIHALAGGHPFLLQAVAGALYDAVVAGRKGDARYYEAGRTFYKQTEDHFSDLWRNLDPRARTAVTILCLGELQGRVADRDFRMEDLGSLARYDVELGLLVDQGLVALWKKDGRHADWGNWVFWQGQRWRATSRRLVWWVSDQVLTREKVDWEEWLDAKRYHGLLTKEEIETLQKLVAKIPKDMVNTAGKVIGLLLKGLPAAF